MKKYVIKRVYWLVLSLFQAKRKKRNPDESQVIKRVMPFSPQYAENTKRKTRRGLKHD